MPGEIISQIIITACFIGVLIVILTDKLNRAITALIGAVIVYFTLIFIEGRPFSIFVTLIFGEDNLHALILILGMLFIVQICISAGVFQYIAFKLIKSTKGSPIRLLIVISAITFLVATIMGNILTVLIMIPLTIDAARILKIDPGPYIVCLAVTIPVGEIVFSISSVPSILISTFAGLTFIEYFLNIGLFCFLLFGITVIYFNLSFHNKLTTPAPRLVAVLMEYNAWNYVPNRTLFYKSLFILIAVLICFVIVPPPITPDMIALTGALILLVISKINSKEIIERIDLTLILYLLAIFTITGGMEEIGVIETVGQAFSLLVGSNTFAILLSVLWISALLSSAVDNIPVVKVLLPIVSIMSGGYTPAYYSLTLGAGLGDNLTPLGDTIIVRSITEEHGQKFSNSLFFKIGFKASLIHLITISIYYTILYYVAIGLIIILILGLLIFFLIFFRYRKNKKAKRDKELMV